MASTALNDMNDRPLRALHVVSGDLWAGAEVQMFQLLQEFQRTGGVRPRAVILNPGLLADKLAATGVTVDVLEEAKHSFLELFRELKSIIATWRPHVVHTHRRKEHILGGLAGSMQGIPVVATIHGRSEFSVPWWHARQQALSMIENLMLRQIHSTVIAVSEELAPHLNFPPSKTAVVPNGINVHTVRAAAADKLDPVHPRADYTIVYVGRLVPVKRVDRIIETMELLHRRQPGAWRLWIVGDGPERNLLEHMVASHNLADVVRFSGFLANPLPLLAQADALVFASEHEGLPMTALEALALGVPIVSPELGGLSNLIRHSGHGCVSNTSSVQGIADALSTVIKTIRHDVDIRMSKLPSTYCIAETARMTQQVYEAAARARLNSSNS